MFEPAAQPGQVAVCLAEAWGALNELSLNGLFGPDNQGTWWNVTGGGQGVYPPSALYLNNIMQSTIFNRLQRWLGRFLYRTNAYAISAVDNLTNLVIGPGYQIVADTDAHQRRIDEWIEANNWHERTLEAYASYLVDGELFYRCFGDKVRFVDPDFVYSADANALQGIITEPDDYERVTSFVVNQTNGWNQGVQDPETVSAKEMQHRKQAFSREPRGFSLLLAIREQLVRADMILANLGTTLDAQARIAFVRTVDAPQDVAQVIATGSTNSRRLPAPTQQVFPGFDNGPRADGIENFAPGSIATQPTGVKLEMPASGLMADKYVTVLGAVLRQIAARVGLPASILAADQSDMAAYTAALLPNSYLVRSIKLKQESWARQDKKILEMCGLSTQGVEITFPSPVIIDQAQTQKEEEMLLNKRVLSKRTLADNHSLDYESELKQIQQEDLNDPPQQEQTLGRGEGESDAGLDPAKPVLKPAPENLPLSGAA